MSKKTNTVLFVLGATLANMVLMILFFTASFVAYGILVAPHVPQLVNSIMLIVLFVLSIVATYLVYHKIVNYISTRVDMEKYFDPIFRTRKR